MEGFLSLEQAAQQLEFTVSELTRQIEEGRVVAIVREGSPWLSTGEVTRLKRQSEKSGESSKEAPAPLVGSRLHRASRPEPAKPQAESHSRSEPEPPVTAPVVAAVPVAPPALKAVEAASASPPTAPKAQPEPSAPTPVVPVSPPSVPAAAQPPAVARPAAVAQTSAASPEAAPAQAAGDASGRKVLELNKRCAELEARGQELEATVNRLKTGLSETEATLKRNRIARGNLENEVIGLQDQLSKSRTRSEALEREVQHLGAELERVEELHAGEVRRLRSNKERAPDPREATSQAATVSAPEFEDIRQRMLEKDRLLTQEYEQRGLLRSQLEDVQQKYFELKALYDKEKTEWSEVLAKSVQNQNLLREQIEELKAKNPKGWNPFRRDK